MERLCTICARGGSNGVKNKNIRNLAGKPLIAHSIEQAKKSGLFKFVAVSSDSDEILSIAEKYGADLMIRRPSNLATAEAPKVPAIQHCVAEVEKITKAKFDTLVDLDATSPLRAVQDIIDCVQKIEESTASNLLTAMPARRSPYFNMVEINEAGVLQLCKKPESPIVRRQDSPKCYDINASIYVWKRDSLFENTELFKKDTLLFVMPEERSIDIDTEFDFDIVNYLADRTIEK